MATPRDHLTHAPIAEAIINYRVQPRPDITFADLRPLAEQFQANYSQLTHLIQAQVRVGPGAMQHTENDQGWLLRSDQRAVAAQFRLDGFTLNKLPEYTCWEDVFGESQRLWTAYARLARPISATQLSVRYINSLDIPAAGLAALLTLPPQTPPGTPDALQGALSRTIVHDAARGARAIVTQAIPAPPVPNQVKVVLDIDVSHIGSEDPNADFSAIFQGLRELKNEIFFASLTEDGIAPYL